ncbi:hypothetical protein D3C78_1469770 [compost metagenome]
MREHEFRSEEPMITPTTILKAGEHAPEAGPYACAGCAESVVATLITLEKDQVLPVCQTCGPMTAWVQRR